MSEPGPIVHNWPEFGKLIIFQLPLHSFMRSKHNSFGYIGIHFQIQLRIKDLLAKLNEFENTPCGHFYMYAHFIYSTHYVLTDKYKHARFWEIIYQIFHLYNYFNNRVCLFIHLSFRGSEN